ncbi:hypothetical protein SAMN05421819_0849 [Bryocella elongata]|uniref:Uncharacterized protein n=1 Tax=Bryocella elongata TaxID=863522 RepID=A0A1H5U302_9BACT|nr:hypothetical protein [Bryocella elongata]SEF69465.1 hypothetical protein SAMN05421819_0849 [Bryocella elongata]
MSGGAEDKYNKSMGDLGREASWFAGHNLIAVFVVLVLVIGVGITRPDPTAAGPKLTLTALSFAVATIVGALVARFTGNNGGRYVWIAGLIVLLGASVWVIDLQTGPGLCAECGPGHLLLRIWRTFFDFYHGSGLMDGAGPLVGCWIPVAMVGYAIGSALGATKRVEV